MTSAMCYSTSWEIVLILQIPVYNKQFDQEFLVCYMSVPLYIQYIHMYVCTYVPTYVQYWI